MCASLCCSCYGFVFRVCVVRVLLVCCTCFVVVAVAFVAVVMALCFT